MRVGQNPKSAIGGRRGSANIQNINGLLTGRTTPLAFGALRVLPYGF